MSRYPQKKKFLAIYKAAQNNHPSAQAGMNSLNVTERKLFDEFFFDCGGLFLELKDELDQGLEDIADDCPTETDPRKWNGSDWEVFLNAVKHHKYREIYTLMAQGKSNIHLIWEEIERRLD